jgi:cytochrome b561
MSGETGSNDEPTPAGTVPKPTSAAQRISTSAPSGGGVLRTTAIVLLALIVGGIGAAAYHYIFVGRTAVVATAAASKAGPELTESAFVARVEDSSDGADLTAEWRAVRSDHKIIAYAVAQCLGVNISIMPRAVFSRLLLDLTPDGGHGWTRDRGQAVTPISAYAGEGDEAATSAAGTIHLTGYMQAALSLSDAIGRARLAAADGAGLNYPHMVLFGWITVGVSAAATMFITLRSSMSGTSSQTDPKWWQKISRVSYFMFGVLAILLSATGTVLTSIKQFYDPTSVFMRDEQTLVQLTKLHDQVALGFIQTWDDGACKPSQALTAQNNFDLTRYEATLVTYQNGISRYATNVSYVENNTNNNGTTAKPATPPETGTPAPSPPPAQPGAGTHASLQ